MIFSQFFSPNYKSSDPEKRIASIEKLNKDLKKDKSILHELAFNDASDAVSLAALNKLNSFALWMKSAETSSSARIKKHAQQACQAQLEDESIVSDKLFVAFMTESKNKPLLEKLLFTSKRLQSQDSVLIKILFSLNNANHVRRFFQEHANSNQQILIVEKVDEAKTLARFSKHAKDDQVIKSINDKIAIMANMAEKPIRITQQITMINSRLLALKEASQYEYLRDQLAELSDEYAGISPDMECLGEQAQFTLSERYKTHRHAAMAKLAKLEDAHHEQQLIAKTKTDIDSAEEQCKHVQQQIDLLLSPQLSSMQSEEALVEQQVAVLHSQLAEISTTLETLKQQVNLQSQLRDINQLNIGIDQQQAQLANVFKILAYGQKSNILSQELGQIFVDQEKQSETLISQDEIMSLKEKVGHSKAAFSQLKEESKGLLPALASKEFAQTLSKVNALIKHLNEHYIQIESKCEQKLKAVDRMIVQGKYKPAMAMFHNIQKLYERVAANAPLRLQKLYEQVSVEISKLQEWQAYIAQPRKPALLEQAEALANAEFEDPYERSHSVKRLRQEWMSLGLLYTSEDEAHNKAFDGFIEKAFVPCRAFFAELERQRELNLQQALNIIEEAKQLDVSLPAAELGSKMSALKTRFNKLGEIEKGHVNKVRRDFAKALKPYGAVISNAQQQSAEQKQVLINQALKLAAQSTQEADLPEAVDKAKALQQQWKQLGFAGKNTDNELWHAFRQANDELFTRFHKNVNDKKDASQAEFESIDKEISELTRKVKSAKNTSELQFYDEEYAELLEKANASDEMNAKKLQTSLRKADDAYTKCSQGLNDKREAGSLNDLFAFLQAYNGSEIPEQYEPLLGRYKSWVKGDVPKLALLQGLDRIELTQVAAILIDVPYSDVPIGDESARQKIQLHMMASKLQGDAILDAQSVLATWVSLGPIQIHEQDSLAAMQKLFIR